MDLVFIIICFLFLVKLIDLLNKRDFKVDLREP